MLAQGVAGTPSAARRRFVILCPSAEPVQRQAIPLGYQQLQAAAPGSSAHGQGGIQVPHVVYGQPQAAVSGLGAHGRGGGQVPHVWYRQPQAAASGLGAHGRVGGQVPHVAYGQNQPLMPGLGGHGPGNVHVPHVAYGQNAFVEQGDAPGQAANAEIVPHGENDVQHAQHPDFLGQFPVQQQNYYGKV